MARPKKINTSAKYFSPQLSSLRKDLWDYPLTFLAAPPGAGKTVFAQSIPQEKGLVRIQIYDGGLRILERSLREAFRSPWPQLADAECGGLNDLQKNLQEIRSSDMFIKIVIEDIHRLGKDAAAAAEDLCRLAAASNGRIRFFITSRVRIWESASREVAAGNVRVIPAKLLFLDKEDIVRYMHACGIRVDRKEAGELARMTDGWMLALHFMVLSWADRGHLELNSDLEEYFSGLWAEPLFLRERQFAQKLCLMESFTALQAARFTEEPAAGEILKEMQRQQMFLFWNEERGWYEMGSLWRQYLLKELERSIPKQERRRLLTLAGDVLAAEGRYVQAVGYYYEAEAFHEMMISIEKGQRIGNDEEKREQYSAYYRRCPRVIRSRYHLAMLYMAWAFFNSGELELYREASLEFLEDLGADQELSAEQKNSLLCDYSLFKAMTDYEDLHKVRQDYENALAVFDGVKRTQHSVIPRTFGSASLLSLFFNQGSLEETLELLGEISETASALIGGGWAGIRYTAQAEAAFLRLDFDRAEILMDCARRECREYPDRSEGVQLCIAFLQARINFMRGEGYNMKKSSEMRFLQGDAKWAAVLEPVQAACDDWGRAKAGIKELESEWILSGRIQDSGILYPAIPYAYLMHMTVLLENRKYTKLLSCEDLFFGKEPLSGSPVVLESAAVMFASAWYALGMHHYARERLKTALELAEETGNLYSLVCYGENLVPLLHYFSNEHGNLILRLQKEMKIHGERKEQFRKTMGHSSLPGLTARESQVALCAGSGMINREIAQELGISENTVKTTLQRVFAKLEITSRRQIAQKLGSQTEAVQLMNEP